VNDIDRFREKLSAGKPKGDVFRPPLISDFATGEYVLAFDPTLTNCGWVRLEVMGANYAGGPLVNVWDKRTIRPSTGHTGFMATWDKARLLNDELGTTIRSAVEACAWIVCETPWVGSGGHRTESALIASTFVYMHAGEHFRPVSAQHAYAVLCGGRRPPTARAKKDIALSVARYIPESSGRNWNEHERDAAALALTFLHDLKRSQDGREEQAADQPGAR
jgi:hypothetical protein